MIEVKMNAMTAKWEARKQGVMIRSATILLDLIDLLEAMGQRDILVDDGAGKWIAM